MPFPCLGFRGNQRLWTKEKVLEGLARAAQETMGPLPCCDATYNRIKKGHLDWPCSRRVLQYFGSMARGWMATGASFNRISLHNIDWTDEEKEYLLERAGIDTLAHIASRLGRSYGAVRGQLRARGTTSRSNQGYVSAAELAKIYSCPYHRVRELLHSGVLTGRYDSRRNRWDIDTTELSHNALLSLRRPKRTHKNCPTDLGDYYRRYGLCRKLFGDRVLVLKRA